MRFLPALPALLLLSACETKTPPAPLAKGPLVLDVMYSAFDLDALKGGEWMETETTKTTTERGGTVKTETTRERTACVETNAEVAWFESTRFVPSADIEKGMRLLVCVDRKTRKVTKAFYGKAGETGQEIQVSPAVEDEEMAVKGTATLSTETVKVGTAELKCGKAEIQMTVEGMKSTATWWLSEDLPIHAAGRGPTKRVLETLTWAGDKPSLKAMVVRSTSEITSTDGKLQSSSTFAVTGFGTDAKSTLKK